MVAGATTRSNGPRTSSPQQQHLGSSGSNSSSSSDSSSDSAGPGEDFEDEPIEGDNADTADGRREKKKGSIGDAISRILSPSEDQERVLSKSQQVKTQDRRQRETNLESKARRLIKSQKLNQQELGHVRDPTSVDQAGVAMSLERERLLRKTAQRGVVRLFNAIKASQNLTHAASSGHGENTLKRKREVTNMSKESFLGMLT